MKGNHGYIGIDVSGAAVGVIPLQGAYLRGYADHSAVDALFDEKYPSTSVVFSVLQGATLVFLNKRVPS